jgi:hypothetical protein
MRDPEVSYSHMAKAQIRELMGKRKQEIYRLPDMLTGTIERTVVSGIDQQWESTPGKQNIIDYF